MFKSSPWSARKRRQSISLVWYVTNRLPIAMPTIGGDVSHFISNVTLRNKCENHAPKLRRNVNRWNWNHRRKKKRKPHQALTHLTERRVSAIRYAASESCAPHSLQIPIAVHLLVAINLPSFILHSNKDHRWRLDSRVSIINSLLLSSNDRPKQNLTKKWA